jgi:GNAT superfamily N-acetyltransferase
MSDQVVIHPIPRDGDLKPLAHLLRHFGGVVATLSDDHIISAYRAETPNYQFYGALFDGLLVGACALRIVHDPLDPAPCGIVNNLIIHPDHRGKGLGTVLLRTMKSTARAQGVQTCLLNVELADDRTMRFYERMGFRGVATLMAAQLGEV